MTDNRELLPEKRFSIISGAKLGWDENNDIDTYGDAEAFLELFPHIRPIWEQYKNYERVLDVLINEA